MDNKAQFILAAINDTQAIIRAVDVKVAALLTGMLIPLSSLGKMWSHLSNIYSFSQSNAVFFVGAVFFLIWLITVFSLVRTMSAIDNPASHIVNSSGCKGAFYGGGLYEFGWLDVVLNRSIVKAGKDVASFSRDYPVTENEIESELSFEHMKLIYIREIKLHRFKCSMRIATMWLLLGLGIYSCSKFG